MKRRLMTIVGVMLLMISMLAGPAAALHEGGSIHEPHHHVLLLQVQVVEDAADADATLHPPGGGEVHITFRRCIDLAGGNDTPVASHHDNLHFGGAPGGRSGHLVIPYTCEGLTS